MSGWREDSLVTLLGAGGILGFLMLGLVLWGRACHSGKVASHRLQASEPGPRSASDPGAARWNFRGALNALDSIGDALDEGDWEAARQFFDAFRRSVPTLPSPELKHPDISLALVDFFNFYRVELERALTAQEANRARFACNQLGNIVWDLRTHLNRIPLPELGRLHYLSRDLEYWARVGDEDMLRIRTQELAKTWADLRPVLLDRKGREVAEDMDSLLLRLKRAESVDEYQEVVTDMNTLVRQVEGIFADIR